MTDSQRTETTSPTPFPPPPRQDGGRKPIEDPPAHKLRAGGRLPTGRHGLTREQVVHSQRTRLIDSMAHLCATKGYSATTIAEIVAGASVSRATYYEIFRDKEDCFVATMEDSLRRLMDTVMPAVYESEDWADQVREVVTALLRFIASDPDYSRTAMLEAVSGGERAYEIYRSGQQMIITLLDQGRSELPSDASPPTSTARAVFGGCESLISAEMVAGRTERVPELIPDILYIAYAAYLGQEEALRRMREVAEL